MNHGQELPKLQRPKRGLLRSVRTWIIGGLVWAAILSALWFFQFDELYIVLFDITFWVVCIALILVVLYYLGSFLWEVAKTEIDEASQKQTGTIKTDIDRLDAGLSTIFGHFRGFKPGQQVATTEQVNILREELEDLRRQVNKEEALFPLIREEPELSFWMRPDDDSPAQAAPQRPPRPAAPVVPTPPPAQAAPKKTRRGRRGGAARNQQPQQ